MKKLFVVVVIAVGVVVCAVAVGALSGREGRGAEAAEVTGAASTRTAAPGAVRTPVLVELFTSEGCSSCPPADALLSRLEKTQPVAGAEVIPLALHVDYWNYLGWADPFSAPEYSARQGEYASAYGKDGVYTPQMIVDGVKEFAGGNSSLAFDSIARAAASPKAEVKITRAAESSGAGIRIGVRIEQPPQLSEGDRAYVLLAVTESDLSTDVRRGENAGRKLGHVGVVRRLTTLGPLAGGAFAAEATVAPEQGWRRENLRAVIFAQERGSRRILAAGAVKLFE